MATRPRKKKRTWTTYSREPYRGGGAKIIATVTGDTKHPGLHIGSRLRDKGFDVSKRYTLMFDDANFAIGLLESKTGYKCMVTSSPTQTSMAFTISAAGFVKKFDLQHRYEATDIERDGEIWVLPLRRITK